MISNLAWELRQEQLKEYLDEMVKTAEKTVERLKDYQKDFNNFDETKSKSKGLSVNKEDFVIWAINYAGQINFNFEVGARTIGQYMEAKGMRSLK